MLIMEFIQETHDAILFRAGSHKCAAVNNRMRLIIWSDDAEHLARIDKQQHRFWISMPAAELTSATNNGESCRAGDCTMGADDQAAKRVKFFSA